MADHYLSDHVDRVECIARGLVALGVCPDHQGEDGWECKVQKLGVTSFYDSGAPRHYTGRIALYVEGEIVGGAKIASVSDDCDWSEFHREVRLWLISRLAKSLSDYED